MSSRMELGRAAEDAAANYLLSLGYTLVTRRWKRPGGELDLVAMDGETLVFVEVKATSAPGFSPEDAVSDSKFRHLETVASRFVSEHGLEETPQRFDLIALDGDGLRHYEDFLRF